MGMIFEMIKSPGEGDETSQDLSQELSQELLLLCSSLKTAERMVTFKPYVPDLLSLMGGTKYRIAVNAANCIYLLATNIPSLIELDEDEIGKISEKSSDNLWRITTKILEALRLYICSKR